MIAFFSLYRRRSRQSVGVGGTIFLLMGILYFPLREFQSLINPFLRVAATVFSSSVILFYCCLTAGETAADHRVDYRCASYHRLVYLDRITFANRPTVTKSELDERTGYNDETVMQ